jgi:ubiquitin-conjugating enzyme E2 Q
MTLKQFNVDVAAAKLRKFEGVKNVHRGDSDGEVVFTFSHESFRGSIDVQVLTSDPDLYPSKTDFLVFTATELAGVDFVSALESLADDCRGKSVCDVINTISLKLPARLRNPPSSQRDSQNDSDDASSSLGDYDDGFGWDAHETDDLVFNAKTGPSTIHMASSSQRRLERDLRAAREDGMHVGVLKSPVYQSVEAISLSIRAAKLGILDEYLQAWGLSSSDYLVLLMQYPSQSYPSLHGFLQKTSQPSSLRLCFGKCAVAKPSLESARWALSDMANKKLKTNDQPSLKKAPDEFQALQMSNTIDSLLKSQLAPLVSLRRTHSVSWDDAQSLLFRISRTGIDSRDQDAVRNSENDDKKIPVIVDDPVALSHDYALDGEEDFNIAMVCAQFALRRFAKCTRYCLACHQRIKGTFEPMKPYVCSDPLCLYQCLTLGLGTNTEHEIINSPAVVDLLISYWYTALAQAGVRHYPRGLGIKVFSTDPLKAPSATLLGDVHFPDKLLRIRDSYSQSRGLLRNGTAVLLVTHTERIIYRISLLEGHVYELTDVENSNVPLDPDVNILNQGSSTGWAEVRVFLPDHELDDLPESDQSRVLVRLTEEIPSVLEMRTYLTANIGNSLDHMTSISKNSLAVLRWIVASNTSLIVQDAPILDPTVLTDRAAGSHEVLGMGHGWLQFRFAQGSPEKEQEFVKVLQSMRNDQMVPQNFPTMFAWHGSPIRNWHSIIRYGLDFIDTTHGRAYGNGVYFSRDINVSQGYTGMHSRAPVPTIVPNSQWPKSCLNIHSSLSLCEIINRPTSFVSCSPHYVVKDTDWIQCRYLFVKISPTPESSSLPYSKGPDDSVSGYLTLEEGHRPLGKDSKAIEIPLSALPASRRADFKCQTLTSVPSPSLKQGSIGNPVYISDDDGDDIDFGERSTLDDGRIETSRLADGKRRRHSSTSPHTMANPASKLKVIDQGSKTTMDGGFGDAAKCTIFHPGALQLETLPRLPQPSWASTMAPSALSAINKEIKQLHNLQSKTRMEDLGWYMDFEKLENVFHWITELHSFDLALPLAQDMERMGCSSIVLELRFGSSYPFSPPFVRVIRPRFQTYAQGAGGHVTAGGAICSELLTNSGWSPALSMEKIFLDVRLRICDTNPPARLVPSSQGDYGILEAADAYRRAVRSHGWEMPPDLDELVKATWE